MIPLLLTLLLPAWAQDDQPDVNGEWRLIYSDLTPFALDEDGTVSGQEQWLDHRLRAGTEGWLHPLLKGTAQVDLAVGTIAGDDTILASTPDERRRWPGSFAGSRSLVFRELGAQTVLGNVQVEGGLTTSHWGLGLMANDGATEPLFGRSDFGDRVLRLRATHIPSGDGPPPRTTWLTTVAADLVVADEIARLDEGQEAIQLIVSALGLGRRGSKVGAYFVARQQWDGDERQTQAFVLDGYGDAWHELGDELRLRTAVEVASVAGRTSRATTYEARDRVGILALNAAALAALEVQETLTLHLTTGYASGDGNPDDGVSHEFSFDRDFGVGMVGFDEVMAGIEGRAWTQVTDPDIAGQPPDGAELLVSEGAFKRAAFLQPAIQLEPTDWLDLRLGYTISGSTAYYAHPFTSTRNGGVPTNHTGVPVDSRLLGAELDWSIGAMMPEREHRPDAARFGLQLQGGHFGPGPALDGPGMPATISLMTATGRLIW